MALEHTPTLFVSFIFSKDTDSGKPLIS